MIHKFQEHKQTLTNTVAEALGTYLAMPAGKTFGEVNTSERIILMIDEAHRTQSSDLGDNLFEAFPNATRIAFTGTPLLKDEKTANKFGPIVHAYTMQRAVEDETVAPLLYEERVPELDINEEAVNRWFEKITSNLSDVKGVYTVNRL